MNPLYSLTLLYFVLLFALAWPLSKLLARIEGPGFIRLAGFERRVLRLMGTDPDHDMNWREYALAVLAFNALGVVALYLLQRLQGGLPLNPAGMSSVSPMLAFNTAVSFVTNTDWQAYSGESTMSHLTQMLGLTTQNFLSAATAMAVAFALMRAFTRQKAQGIGNFWQDLIRSTFYVLLPLSLLIAVAMVAMGVIQNLDAPVVVHTLEGSKQLLAQGPVASQEAIKMLGTNGGGFFNANSAHPYENPTALSNLIQMLAIFLIPAALCFCFGRLLGKKREGIVIVAAMTVIFLGMLALIGWSEQTGNPALHVAGVDQGLSVLQSGGNMEGKEVRFGIAASNLFTAITTSASCGAVNTMHDSLTALGGLVPMWLIQFGEVVFGGVGSGFYGVLMYALIGVFVAGLMIGRTPEYLGKKLESHEIKLAALATLITPTLVLLGAALAVVRPEGLAGISNPGPHGFSQVLYAFSSAANNNGSAFAGLNANTNFYNFLLAVAMWFGRFAVIVPVLAIAGSLAAKKHIPASPGTLPTDSTQFVVILASTIVVVGALTFLPALALGPIVEHLTQIAH